MRILIVTQYFWPENFRITDLVRTLRGRGHEITVLTGQPNYPGGRFFPGYGWFRKWNDSYEGVPIRRCPLLPRRSGRSFNLIVNYVSFALSSSLLAPFRCRGPYDAIFVYEPSPITVALPAVVLRALGRAPVLLWVLDLWPESVAAASGVRVSWVMRILSSLVRFIYRRCDMVLVQSRGFCDRVVAAGARPESVRYFPSWVEDVFLSGPPAAPRYTLPVLPDGFRVTFTGNIGAAQDFPSVLRAAARLRSYPDIHWVLVGEGRMAAELRARIAAEGLGDQVHLLGSFPVEAMPRLCAEADCLLVSLKRDPIFALTIPAKIQAYLACGRPILGMLDGEGARIIEQAGAGFVCPSEDWEALAGHVLRLRDMSAAERAQIGSAGRRYCEDEFTTAHLVPRLEGWLQETAETYRKREGTTVRSVSTAK